MTPEQLASRRALYDAIRARIRLIAIERPKRKLPFQEGWQLGTF